MNPRVVWFAELGLGDVERVGGKNASLGEMVQNLADAGVRVPNGFATTADAYREFLTNSGLAGRINDLLTDLDVDDVQRLSVVGTQIRGLIEAQPFPEGLEREIRTAYATLAEEGRQASWAVRSSATAEDLPDASFAGQQETYLNISGVDNTLRAVKLVYASLYTDRAIAYRVHSGYPHTAVALSAGIQKMVRSDVGSSGVMFTIDTESGFTDAVFITSSYGLGEAVVQGAVNPDEFYVYKPALRACRPAILKRGVGAKATKMIYTDETSVGGTTGFVPVDPAQRGRLSLTDGEVTELAAHAVRIEEHYGRPMDIEWGKDGIDGLLYILQARPETVQSRASSSTLQRFKINNRGPVLIEGRAIGQKIGTGAVHRLTSIDQM
ncbi:MAG: PEP/pyruvate-binding domain-containing protein, partial [Propionibacteriaceae bacterium]